MHNILNYRKSLLVIIVLCFCVQTFSQEPNNNLLYTRVIQELVKIEDGKRKATRDIGHYCMALYEAFEQGKHNLPKDIQKASNFKKMALDYYKSCASNNDVECLLKAGWITQNSTETVNEGAFSYYLKAAELGNSRAQFMVGQCYIFGQGTEKNEKLGLEWLYKSAKNGNVEAFNYIEEYKVLNKISNKSTSSDKDEINTSGFYIQPKLILTVAHAISGKDSVLIKNDTIRDYIKGKVIASDIDKDLALLEVDKESKNFVSLKGLTKGYCKANDSIFIPRISKEIFIVKKGKVIRPLVTQVPGIDNKKGNRVQIDAKIIPGDSGAPILDSDYRLIGITSDFIRGKSNRWSDAILQFGRPLISIMEFLIDNNIQISTKIKELKTEEEIKNYLKASSIEIISFKSKQQVKNE